LPGLVASGFPPFCPVRVQVWRTWLQAQALIRGMAGRLGEVAFTEDDRPRLAARRDRNRTP